MLLDNESVKKSINDVLQHYEEGWDIFSNAKSWEHPVTKKPSAEGVDGLPDTWLDLAEKVIGIIAKEKYDLDCYDNVIEVISSDDMLDNYASNGLPINYEHWSFGLKREKLEKDFKAGRMGLAYEIVINTDPVIAYNMDSNSPLMQLLVIAHASFGHNSFFKGNHMFKEHTQANSIMDDLREMRDYIHKCEAKYGFKEVELLLDSCHALMSHGVNTHKHTSKKNKSEKSKDEQVKAPEKYADEFDSKIFDGIRVKKEFEEAQEVDPKAPVKIDREENLLVFIAENAPELPEWKGTIMKMIARQSQYFYPQIQTQVMNEGWASFWHYTLMHDMADLGLVNDGMILELEHSHSSVLMQPDYDSPYFNGRFNPYALGFAIFTDIKRMCENPTKEDELCFPYLAGKGDWLSVFKDTMEDFRDESFIEQFLSPKVMRDFNMFSVRDDAKDDYQEVTAIHEKRGFERVKRMLSSEYRTENMRPVIEICEYNKSTDRALFLEHIMYNERPLEEENMKGVLKHMHSLWGHPVVIDSVNVEDGVIHSSMSSPESYIEGDNYEMKFGMG